MSEEEQVDLDIKSEQAKFKNKNKVKKRKSKTTCEDEEDTNMRVQHKSKKMKVEPALNNSLLKWLNKSEDKSQKFTTKAFQSKSQKNSINNTSIDSSIENIEVNLKTSVSINERNQIDFQDSTNYSSKPTIDQLLSKIDFSNLKAKLNAKLSLSPRGCSIPKTQNQMDSNGSSPFKNGKSKKNQLSSNKKKTTSDNDVNGKNTNCKEESEIESDEHSQFFEDDFLDSDDSGMIFISNKYERRKFVDTKSDSFPKTPVKECEIMAPPYSPLSPLFRKSLRATRSPSPSSLKDSPLRKSPGPMKSPLSLLSRSPWKKNSPLKSPRISNHQIVKRTNENTDDSALQLSQPCKGTEIKEKSPNISKKLFELPTVLPCELIKESTLEKKQDSIECKEDKETVKSKISKKKHKQSLKTNNSIETNSQINVETSNNESVSDEDFITPKKKSKSEKKKRIKTDDQQLQLEKLPKNSKSKKKESPNLNSSLLNYFKRVEKEADKSTEENVPDITDSVKTEPVDGSTDDIKINEAEAAVNSVEKKKHNKKSKKRKRSNCVEIRFDFESDDSRDRDFDVESKKKEKNSKAVRKSDKGEKTQAQEEQEALTEAIIEKPELKNENEEERNQATMNRESKNLVEKEEIAVKKIKKRKNKNHSVQQQIEMKETNKDCKLDTKSDENEEYCVETNEAEDFIKNLPDKVENNNCKEIEAVNKNELETKKKRGRGRPKKETTIKTPVNEPVEETDKSVIKEINEDSKVDFDDKENPIRILESKQKSKEKKKLQEHCENVAEKEIDEGGESKTEGTASLFKYFKKVDCLVHKDKNSSSNILRVEVQVHTPPSTPSKWKRRSAPSPVLPTSAPDEISGGELGEGRRKSSRISEKRQKEETRRLEDEIVVLEEESRAGKGRTKVSDDSDDELFIVKEKKKFTMSAAPQSKVKLASIFMKKPKLSKLETEARQKFLQSGVPDAIRRQTELLRKQEEILEELECYSFPTINHVTQTLATPRTPGAVSDHPVDLGRFKLCHDSGDNVELNLSNGRDTSKTEVCSEQIQNVDGALTRDGSRNQSGKMLNTDQNWKSLMQTEQKERFKEEEWTRPTNVNKALSVLKKRVPSIEETSVFKQVAQTLTSPPSEERETEDSPLLLWSEKYKPESDRDILGNRSSVDILKSWLEARKKVQRRPLCSSSDEESDFLDEASSLKQNTAVLSGPPGCGKTCAVYALAAQLGFKVIELNASCNRNGKRILSDLSEATQSHQVSHQSQAAGQITSFFGTQLNGPALFGAKSAGLTQNGTTSPDVVDLFDSSLEEKVEEKSTAKPKRKRKQNEDDVENAERDSAMKKTGKKERKSSGKLTNGKGKKSLEKQKNEGKKIGKGRNVKAVRNGNTGGSAQNMLSVGKSTIGVGKSTTNVAQNFASVGKSTESDPSEKEDAGISMSIILIEDADIIFSDHDEGFVAALSSLVATSKRPLILATNEERAGHLSKLMRSASSLVLRFETPLYAEIGCFLQLVSILEGIKLSQDKSLLLVHHNRGDIRKCLLALQFYVLSRGSYPTQPHPPWCASSSSQLASLWWLWSSHFKLPPLIHNHARTLLTRADLLLDDTRAIAETANSMNPTESFVSEPVRNNENRPSSVEDEQTQEPNQWESRSDERKATQDGWSKGLVDGHDGDGEPSRESGYGSASRQQTLELREENQQSSQNIASSSTVRENAHLVGNDMETNVASLKAEFSRRFESWGQFQTEKCNMSQLSTMLTCFSQADLMHRKLNLVSPGRDLNPVPQIWQSSPNASSSLDNDVTASLNAPHDVITLDLCASLVSWGRGLLPASVETVTGVNVPYEETKRHTGQAFSLQRSLLSSLSPAESLSRSGFPLDHYSGLRTLARCERARHAASSKRYNRFFNHLKSVNIHLSQSDTERLCRVLWLQ